MFLSEDSSFYRSWVPLTTTYRHYDHRQFPYFASTMAGTHPPAQLLNAFLQCITDEIIPRTARGVTEGNKVFGAAILRKEDLSLVITETNNEKECPVRASPIY